MPYCRPAGVGEREALRTALQLSGPRRTLGGQDAASRAIMRNTWLLVMRNRASALHTRATLAETRTRLHPLR